ncbi:tetratricopeptide repeat protein [Cellulophaga sp. F20128]|uniref:tetratricopeptide repeat protein n=1 Tax=Cellulophaga sp. F20128 TaxID=2926413 RepID=UPI001FF47FA1|nr:tetratricopeptide repeat protein [Cellulophaga sp. F20128]MCK0157486.1 tetratricopeptide repeat protein [Cellulophaga sp. F20128]
MKKLIYFVFLIGCFTNAQEADVKAQKKALTTSKNLTWEGNKELSEDNFVQAEANYRKAIAKSEENTAAPFNLGNAYYNNETYSEAFGRFKQAGELATSKKDKHKAYHNMGNVFMKNKEYEKAVEAYKQALRNNPSDEETRYNLALAMELLKKQQDEEKKNDQNKDQDNKEDQKDQNKDQEKNEGDNKEDDKGKDDEKKDGEDKKDKGDEGDQKNEDEKDGKGDQEKDKKEPNDQGDKPEEQKQPRPNQLSKQQIKNLLEAMQNEEKKVQEKMDAKKVKGAKVKNEKDW